MTRRQARYFPLGDSALTAEFGDKISEPLNKMAIMAAQAIELAGFPGLIETVPAYSSVTVFYDAIAVRRHFPGDRTAFGAVRSFVEDLIAHIVINDVDDDAIIEIAVDFGKDAGLDLDVVAGYSSLSVDRVISIFTSAVYRVYMLGFLPGFTYLGEVDKRIATPRKDAPRIYVPKGSVGIAGRQTGIYSLASPGGWQIVGRTDVELFRPEAKDPCFLKPGDRVRFVEKR